MILEGSKTYPCDFAKVAVMMFSIADFQRCEEELSKLTTNTQQLSNEGEWSYVTTGSVEFGTC